MKQSIFLVFLSLAIGFSANASDTEHYVSGIEGIKAGSVPPPGIYLRSYELWYHADEVRNPDGQNEHVGFGADVGATVERVIWVNDWLQKYIGADFGMHVVLPVVGEDVEMDRLGIHDKQLKFGDMDVSPVILSWHKPRYDLAVDYELILPTGDAHGPAAPGKNFFTNMFTFGGTGYLDSEKTWSLSALTRYEISTEKKGAHYTPGENFHFEWGLGKAFPKHGFEVGLAGYAIWQTTNDTGPGVTWNRHDRYQVFSVGPEGDYFIKPIGLAVAARFEREFGAENRPEGLIGVLTFTKRF